MGECLGGLEEQQRRANCDGITKKCLVKWYYQSCEDCPLYKAKRKVLIKVTVPSVSTLKKRVEAKQLKGEKNGEK